VKEEVVVIVTTVLAEKIDKLVAAAVASTGNSLF
jgi:hypothetical protein